MTRLAGSFGRTRIFWQLTLKARRLAAKAMAARPFGVCETESIMQFARLGTLTCFCGRRHAKEAEADRRRVCRRCGGHAISCEADLLERTASAEEIRRMIESLRWAGIRARGIEIPSSVRSLRELHAFLDEYRGRNGRKPPQTPNAPIALTRATAGWEIA